MPELLYEYATPLAGDDGKTYVAQVWGRKPDDSHLWEGWIVFVPVGGGRSRRTECETTQSSHEHLRYWATGLEPIYLEGAVLRSVPLRVSAA